MKPKASTALYGRIREILESAKTGVARSVNTMQVVSNWLVGREIVEEEQKGKAKAAYGERLLADLSGRLQAEYGNGYSVDNLELFRRLYGEYPDLISEAAPRKLLSANSVAFAFGEAGVRRVKKWKPGMLHPNLSWTHYRSLLRVEKPEARSFYEIEAIQNNWAARELERQIDSLLYERLALSRDKKGLMRLAHKGHEVHRPSDIFKDPVVIEFLGIPESPKLVETELEQALIDNLQSFLLEMGKGFAFVARQQRLTLDGDHFYIDLVFYHAVLKCYVIVDFKTGKLTHQDLGQLQLYVNYYDRERTTAGDNPTLGLILCADKNDAVVVVHVNMLKEGWDVTNLYTIVPLRTANSKTLVEQSIGRGLRLPYGKRTGVGSVDLLTIVSHDRFQEIVDYANSAESIIRGGLRIVGIPIEATRVVVAEPEIVNRITGGATTTDEQFPLFKSSREQEAAKATMEVIRRDFERLPRSANLAQPEIQRQIVEKVRTLIMPAQREIEGAAEKVDVESVVARTIHLHNELSIDIPRITVQPVGNVTRGYREFKLDLSRVNYQPVDSEILIQELRRHDQHRLMSGTGIIPEEKPEDYLVSGLIDFNDISYDEQSGLLYALAGQVVARLRSYLKDENEVSNVLQYHQQGLVNLIHAQMQEHYEEKAIAYEAHVSKGFTTLRPNNYSAPVDEIERDFRAPVIEKQDIRRMLFGGFKKCLYRVQKFDSDVGERRFAVVLENDKEVLKWFKPAKGDFPIYYSSDTSYEPDFVVETRTAKFVCEPKRVDQMENHEVLAKANAAAAWCQHASAHEREHGGKPWTYLLIPHDVINDSKTLQGLAATYAYRAVSAKVLPFVRMTPREEEKYRTCVPLLTLKAAAGAFSEPQHVTDNDWEWIAIKTKHRLHSGMFVAQVVGKSMEPAIPDGAYCLFRSPVEGSRRGIVLVHLRDVTDPETGKRFTIKRYESEKASRDDSWLHEKITLKPIDPAFEPIVLTGADEGQLSVLAEMIEVLTN